jgi:hypothetical protein
MKYAVIGRQAHTLPYVVEVNDKAVTADSMARGFEPMFVVDFEAGSIQRLARGEDGAVMVIDEAFNEGIGRHTTAEQMQEIAE